MARMKFEGFDDLINDLSRIEGNITPTLKAAVYEGAGIVANAIHNEIEAIPTGNGEGEIIAQRKEGLLNGLGISKMDEGLSSVNVKTGFSDYSDYVTPQHPGGEPNALVARSIVSGTSKKAKNNFIKRAAKASEKSALSAMEKTIRVKIDALK